MGYIPPPPPPRPGCKRKRTVEDVGSAVELVVMLVVLIGSGVCVGALLFMLHPLTRAWLVG